MAAGLYSELLNREGMMGCDKASRLSPNDVSVSGKMADVAVDWGNCDDGTIDGGAYGVDSAREDLCSGVVSNLVTYGSSVVDDVVLNGLGLVMRSKYNEGAGLSVRAD